MRFTAIVLLSAIVTMLSLSAQDQKHHSQFGTLPPPQQQETRMLVLGDSLTSGLYATHEQATFVSQLGAMTGFQIARRNGARLAEISATWAEVKAWKPDIVVIEIGLNDVSRGTIADEQWQDAYESLVKDIQATGARAIVCTMFWGGLSKSHPNYSRYISYNQKIKDAATATGADLVDLWSETIAHKEYVSGAEQLSYFAPHYHGDSFHPSDAGHKAIAEAIYRVIGKKMYFPLIADG